MKKLKMILYTKERYYPVYTKIVCVTFVLVHVPQNMAICLAIYLCPVCNIGFYMDFIHLDKSVTCTLSVAVNTHATLHQKFSGTNILLKLPSWKILATSETRYVRSLISHLNSI